MNIGTPFAYSSETCRATGRQIADFILGWSETDPDVLERPMRMMPDLRLIVQSLRSAPYMMRKLVFAVPELNTPLGANNRFTTDAHAVAPLVWASRILILAVKLAKQELKHQAPVNFVNFVLGATSSRINQYTLLGAMAYLQDRSFDCDAATEVCLNDQAKKILNKNMGTWVLGLATAKEGELLEDLTPQQCMITRQAHGAGFEILAMATYHALHEFGPSGIKNKFEIITADGNANGNLETPLYKNEDGLEKLFDNDTDSYEKIDQKYERRPDLILAWDGPMKRRWIELKSYGYNTDAGKKFRERNGKTSYTRSWVPPKKSTPTYIHSAQKQFILDWSSASDSPAVVDFWNNIQGFDATGEEELKNLKPNSHKTWFQAWKYEDKRVKPVKWERVNKKKKLKRQSEEIVVPISIPWVDTRHLSDLETCTTKNCSVKKKDFDKIQSNFIKLPYFKADIIEHSLNTTKGSTEWGQNITNNVDTLNSIVAPFTLRHAITSELTAAGGSGIADEIINKMIESTLPDEYRGLVNGEITEEQIALYTQQIEAKVDEALGPIDEIFETINDLTPDKLEELEDEALEYVRGLLGDNLLEVLQDVEAPEALGFCENN